ncbi:MAG TPA: hypothetical protein VMI33_05665 [Streptosporangiaceae bacterium]|nr:hypothetical protein [Streptosporangiaceae bacterium]
MVTHVLPVIGWLALGYGLAWVLALAVLGVLLLVLGVSRGSPAAVRNAFRHAVAARAPQSEVHVGDQAEPPADTAIALAGLRAADPRFDLTAFLDSTRVAMAGFAAARLADDDRLLRRITTPGFWETSSGKGITAAISTWRRYQGDRSRAASQGSLFLDASWRQPVVQRISLGESGMDRLTVRLALVIVGAVKWFDTDSRPAWRRIDQATQRDWDFVRPTGQLTDPDAVMLPRTCASCGAPYHSDLDDTCRYCHAGRADSQAGWRLDRTYLVIEPGR